jgi:hypothetical protein
MSTATKYLNTTNYLMEKLSSLLVYKNKTTQHRRSSSCCGRDEQVNTKNIILQQIAKVYKPHEKYQKVF